MFEKLRTFFARGDAAAKPAHSARVRTRPAAGVLRQGDVFIVPIDSVPAGLQSRRPVLAEGEVTGHAHRVADPATAHVFAAGADNSLFMEVIGDTATVIHEEHGPVTVPRGSYAIRIQREYHPKEIRRVVD